MCEDRVMGHGPHRPPVIFVPCSREQDPRTVIGPGRRPERLPVQTASRTNLAAVGTAGGGCLHLWEDGDSDGAGFCL